MGLRAAIPLAGGPVEASRLIIPVQLYERQAVKDIEID